MRIATNDATTVVASRWITAKAGVGVHAGIVKFTQGATISNLSSTIAVFSVDAQGKLTGLASLPAGQTNPRVEIDNYVGPYVYSADARHAYSLNPGFRNGSATWGVAGTIRGESVGAGGVLTPMAPLTLRETPPGNVRSAAALSLIADPTSRYLFVNAWSDYWHQLFRDPVSGVLTYAQNSPLATPNPPPAGSSPAPVGFPVFTPSGRFVFLTDRLAVHRYEIQGFGSAATLVDSVTPKPLPPNVLPVRPGATYVVP